MTTPIHQLVQSGFLVLPFAEPFTDASSAHSANWAGRDQAPSPHPRKLQRLAHGPNAEGPREPSTLRGNDSRLSSSSSDDSCEDSSGNSNSNNSSGSCSSGQHDGVAWRSGDGTPLRNTYGKGHAAMAEDALDTLSVNVDLNQNLEMNLPWQPQATARSLTFEDGGLAHSNVTRCVRVLECHWSSVECTNGPHRRSIAAKQ